MIAEELSPRNLEVATILILELWKECVFEEEYQNVQRLLQEDTETIYLAKLQNEYAGFIYLNLRSDYVEGTSTKPVAYIEGIYVRPQFRKLGVGKKLVELGEKWAKAKGAKAYASDTEITNENSIAFHKHIGFEEVNRIVCFVKEIN